MATTQLLSFPKKKLADLARKEGVAGWESMNKEELIKAIARARKKAKQAIPVKVAAKSAKPAELKGKPQKAAARDTSPSSASLIEQRVERAKFDIGVAKDLSSKTGPDLPNGYNKDRIVVMVRDPYWLHVYWELTHQSVQRAEAALGQDWHGAKPILRLLDVSSHETTSTAEAKVKDIEIHGGCNNWYVEVKNPPRSYRIDIGYISRRGDFFCVSRSNVVTTPRPNVADAIDENWTDLDARAAERIYAMSAGFGAASAPSSQDIKELFEERLRRPLNSPPISSAGMGGATTGKQRKFWFQLDAELIVYGATEPQARVTLQGEPVKLRPDGTFTMRFSLPDGRQIIPAVAHSVDGVEERTIVLAVERNTKQLEPTIHDEAEA